MKLFEKGKKKPSPAEVVSFPCLGFRGWRAAPARPPALPPLGPASDGAQVGLPGVKRRCCPGGDRAEKGILGALVGLVQISVFHFI